MISILILLMLKLDIQLQSSRCVILQSERRLSFRSTPPQKTAPMSTHSGISYHTRPSYLKPRRVLKHELYSQMEPQAFYFPCFLHLLGNCHTCCLCECTQSQLLQVYILGTLLLTDSSHQHSIRTDSEQLPSARRREHPYTVPAW